MVEEHYTIDYQKGTFISGSLAFYYTSLNEIIDFSPYVSIGYTVGLSNNAVLIKANYFVYSFGAVASFDVVERLSITPSFSLSYGNRSGSLGLGLGVLWKI